MGIGPPSGFAIPGLVALVCRKLVVNCKLIVSANYGAAYGLTLNKSFGQPVLNVQSHVWNTHIYII